ncbi:retrovirus-related pol polyprotein from transposon TNT 1-94 [Tanacetum coccineum]
MLEKGNYIPWESRFRRFLDNKLEDGGRMWNSIQNGPYQRPLVVDPTSPNVPILESLSKMTEGNKKQYIADVRVMNYLLQAIPNDIYNSVDAFCSKRRGILDFVHERLTTLVNIMDRNNVHPILVAINTKFLNCSQPEWSKYVTMDGRVDIQTKNEGYGGNANKNAGRNRTQGFNTGNASDESNQIIQRVPRTESTPGKANVQCYNCNEKGHYARESDENAETVPSYDAKAVSQVHASSKVHEQVSHGKRKTIIQTTDDDQIDSNIIFDDPFVENNGGTSEHDSTAHDEYREIQMLAYNVQREAENKKQRELRNDKDTIDRLVKEKEKIQNDFLKVENEKIIIQHETQLEKKAFKEREDRYLDDILDLEEKLSSHDRIVYKMGQSIQTIHMLGKKPNKVYDPFLKAGTIVERVAWWCASVGGDGEDAGGDDNEGVDDDDDDMMTRVVLG